MVNKKTKASTEEKKEDVVKNQPSTVEDIVGSAKQNSEVQAEIKGGEPVAPVQPVQPVQPIQQPQPFYVRIPDASLPTQEVSGILDTMPEGHGFLRPKFIPSHRDIYISQSQIRKFMLRAGDLVSGLARPPKDTERYFGLLKVEKVNDMPAEESLRRPYFDDLTPIYPKTLVKLSTGKLPLSTRIIDLVAPIGFGQRGMIVSPPKAGKTTVLKEIAAGITQNFPKVHLMAALIGERPEEVTDISQSVRGDVVASNFDEPPENQTRVAEITLDRAKRLVEMGINVIILLDSVTRLARAYNLSVEPSGRTLTGGFDPAALWPAKRFFGAARNCQEGGSLTIIGTTLVETGSRMDDLIYEEFKGTGNMELHLDRKLADRRIFPAINVERSGTRQEELLIPEKEYKRVVTMRRMLDMLNPDERTQTLIDRLGKSLSNEEFLETLGKGA
ncbi:MAG: transcription termination factor Rho [Candidatus Levybacteria bacterium]|nr:transcription termination factor Rho [Candidatus Levybacteria bacterium]